MLEQKDKLLLTWAMMDGVTDRCGFFNSTTSVLFNRQLSLNIGASPLPVVVIPVVPTGVCLVGDWGVGDDEWWLSSSTNMMLMSSIMSITNSKLTKVRASINAIDTGNKIGDMTDGRTYIIITKWVSAYPWLGGNIKFNTTDNGKVSKRRYYVGRNTIREFAI